jgi:hypothetical protein
MTKTKSNHPKDQIVLSSKPISAKSMRALRWNEAVRPGDFIKADRNGFEPWVGPSGFRAGSFVKSIYRRLRRTPSS